MQKNNFSPTLKLIVDKIERTLFSESIWEMGTEHLVLAVLLEEKDASTARRSMMSLAQVDDIVSDLEALVAKSNRMHSSAKSMRNKMIRESGSLTKLLEVTENQARSHSDGSIIQTSHIILGILRLEDDPVCQVLFRHNVNYNRYAKVYFEGVTKTERSNDDRDQTDHSKNEPKKEFDLNAEQELSEQKKIKKLPKKNKTLILDKYCRDLTRAASQGLLDPVTFRGEELERITQIITRRRKNNVLLIGEAGVGKSAIPEGLAINIAEKRVPLALMEKRIMSLNLTAMIAGTKYRGQFEERINGIINELSKSKEIILFIDEFHTIVGTGAASGSLDAANIIKPALARGEMQCIAATTQAEFREHIEKDLALMRRFQNVVIDPTTTDQTLLILKSLKTRYEKFHSVTYTPEALEACVTWPEKYLSNRFFPDKAIDVMDESGAYASLRVNGEHAFPEELRALKDEINQFTSKNNKQAQLDQNISELRNLYQEKFHQWKLDLQIQHTQVCEEDVLEVLSTITRIPLKNIQHKNRDRVISMNKAMTNSIIGQEYAVKKVVQSVSKNLLGMRAVDRPIGTFLFVGQTGVGKTALAKALAKNMFHSEDALIRVDMSEYMEKYSVSRLLGSPPGYIGYREGGQLTERVKKTPHAVLLLDELEKAHKDVLNILLQIMDEGKIEDSVGRVIDFRNIILIMTSNVGGSHLAELKNSISFQNSDETLNERYKHRVMKSVESMFSPEFINRIDDVIVFNALSQNHIAEIFKQKLSEVLRVIYRTGIQLKLSDDVIQFLIEKSFDPKFGARHIQRVLRSHVEDIVLDYILSDDSGVNTSTEKNSKIVLQMKINKKEGRTYIVIPDYSLMEESSPTKNKVVLDA